MTSSTGVVVARAIAGKRPPPISSASFTDALMNGAVQPRDWARFLRRVEASAEVKEASAVSLVDRLLKHRQPDDAVASKKLSMLLRSLSSWESAMRLAALSETIAGDRSRTQRGLLVGVGASPRTILHVYRALMMGGKTAEATRLLSDNAASLTTPPSPTTQSDLRDRNRNVLSQRQRRMERRAFASLVKELVAIGDVVTLHVLHHEFTGAQREGAAPLTISVGATGSLLLAARITKHLLEWSPAAQGALSKMERASIVLKLASMSPGGALPMSIRKLLERIHPPPPLSRRLLSALDGPAADAALLPWCTVQSTPALLASPLTWLKQECSAGRASACSEGRMSSDRLVQLKRRLEVGNTKTTTPPPNVCDALLGATGLKQALCGNKGSAVKGIEHHMVQSALRRVLQTKQSSVRLPMWLLTRDAQHSSLCRVPRCRVVGHVIAQVVGGCRGELTRSSCHTANNRLDKLTASCAALWRRSSAGRHRLLEAVRRSHNHSFASVVEALLNFVSALATHESNVRTTPCRFPSVVRRLIRTAWVLGLERSDSGPLSTKDMCHLISDLLLRDPTLAELPLSSSLALATALHEAGLPFQDVRLIVGKIAMVHGGSGAAAHVSSTAPLLDVVRLSSSRHYRAGTHDDGKMRCAFPAFHTPTRSALIALQALLRHGATTMSAAPARQDQFMQALFMTFVRNPARATRDLSDLILPSTSATFSIVTPAATTTTDNALRILSIEEHTRLVAAISVMSNATDAVLLSCAAAGLEPLLNTHRVQRWIDAEGLPERPSAAVKSKTSESAVAVVC